MEDSIYKLLKYVDDSKVLAEASTEDEVQRLQENLNNVYQWADTNNMRWNEVKFQIMRLGKDEELKENTKFFTPNYEELIDEKDTIKDLGVLVDSNLRYKSQIMSAVSKARRKLGWVLRTFRTRSVYLLRRLWNSVIQPHLDYGSMVWVGQATKEQKLLLEGLLRTLTKSAWGCERMNYWERLQKFNISNNERRMECYAVIYI